MKQKDPRLEDYFDANKSINFWYFLYGISSYLNSVFVKLDPTLFIKQNTVVHGKFRDHFSKKGGVGMTKIVK